MSTCVKTIRFSAAFSALFAILTYIVSVNIDGGFVQLNSIWISNNFILTVFGGVFTGFFVMLLCEIQRYLENKHEAENMMFAYGISLYQQMYIASQNIKDYIAHQDENVPGNLLFYNMNIAEHEINAFVTIDYTLFFFWFGLFQVHRKFCTWIDKTLRPFVINRKFYLNIAVNQDRIDCLKAGKNDHFISSTAPYTQKALSQLSQEIQPLLERIDEQLQTLDNSCHGRYSWKSHRQALETSYKSLFENNIKKFS